MTLRTRLVSVPRVKKRHFGHQIFNVGLALLLVMVASGCSWMPWNWGKKKSAASTVVTPRTTSTNETHLLIAATSAGKIVSVNLQGRFVALQFPTGQLPAIGTQMVVYRGDAKVGEVKISGPTLGNDLIAADIVLGIVQEGDEVRGQ